MKATFTGSEFSFTYDVTSENFLLYRKRNEIPVILSGDDAEIFKRHIELLNSQPDETLTERIEKAIQIHLYYIENTSPTIHFVD
jgi:hypothetical protein